MLCINPKGISKMIQRSITMIVWPTHLTDKLVDCFVNHITPLVFQNHINLVLLEVYISPHDTEITIRKPYTFFERKCPCVCIIIQIIVDLMSNSHFFRFLFKPSGSVPSDVPNGVPDRVPIDVPSCVPKF